ncbi:hypothetical protein Tco_1538797 [Tanacetum coccineum]
MANRESARDVYSKRKIIVVTKLEIVNWHNYKHLDWITVRRDDDKLYKFKEDNFNRLRIQDIEDMLLLLVQGKLTNLTVEERLAFNVSLIIFTRSVVIQRRVEDLQLGVESYQKKLNVTKLDTYRPDHKRREAYTTYSYPRVIRTRDPHHTKKDMIKKHGEKEHQGAKNLQPKLLKTAASDLVEKTVQNQPGNKAPKMQSRVNTERIQNVKTRAGTGEFTIGCIL